MSDQYDKMTVKELATGIHEHLRRFEADPTINRYPEGHPAGLSDGSGKPYWDAYATPNGSWVRVMYYRIHGGGPISKADAARYLRWLDAGNVGRHHEALRSISRGVPPTA